MKKYYIITAIVILFQYANAQRVETLFDQQYFPEESINGAYCPNSTDDEIGPGGHDFNGGVEFTQQNTWRIETTPQSSILYLDINFSFVGTSNPNIFVRGRRSLEIHKIDSNTNSIVGFRQTRDNFSGYTPWMQTSSGASRWTGQEDGGIFCEDDNKPDIVIGVGVDSINSIFFSMDIQGDTGGSDISDDRNCECDTRVLKIYWQQNIQLAIAPDIDRDGLQDSNFFNGIRVDNNTSSNQSTTNVVVELNENKLKAAIHNNDCKRFNGNIQVALVNKDTNRLYPITGQNTIINWSNGNRRKDFNFRDLLNVKSSKVSYNIPRSELENGNVALILVGDNLRQCHKKCDLCSGYRCNILYQNSREIILNNFINASGTNTMITQARMNSRLPNGDNHYLELPIKISY